jgi:hypothetical protein
MSTDILVNSALGGGIGAVISALAPSISYFEDTSNSSNNSISTGAIIAIVVVIVLFIVLLCTAVYKLTDSWAQVFLCFLFGAFYLMIAILYYGFAGYTFKK